MQRENNLQKKGYRIWIIQIRYYDLLVVHICGNYLQIMTAVVWLDIPVPAIHISRPPVCVGGGGILSGPISLLFACGGWGGGGTSFTSAHTVESMKPPLKSAKRRANNGEMSLFTFYVLE